MNRTASHCYHCHQIVPKQLAVTAEINEQQQLFCCSGCVAVCQTIHVSGLESFYQHIPNVDSLSPPAQNDLTDLESFDLESVQADFVIENDETKQAILLIEGIHCSACVWLIERALNKMPGVQQAIVNLTQKRLKVVWLKNQCVLSDIILQCRQLGYDALPYQSSTALDQYNQSKSNLLYRLGFAGFTMMNLLWISIALYSGADQGEYRYFLQWIAMALATPTLLYSGWPFLSGAYRSIKQGYAGMDVPIAIGALATYLYSAYITLSQSQTGEVYFDTVVNFIFVILIGRYLESVSKYKAVNATQRLLDLQPKIANVIEQNGEIVVKPVKALVLGEVVRIKPGEKIPVDGCVVDGMTEVDESMLTGETNLVGKIIKDDVFAGTLNGAGSIDVKVNGLLTKTVLGKIIQLVESAQMTKAPIQCTTDKIVPWFVLITLSLSMMTFIYWSSVGFESALLAAVSVLIITCPCAFGLATPMSIAVASGVASVHGILIKNGAVFEQLSSIKNIVFDKTGTLTQGKIEVKEMVLVDDCDYSQETLLKWLATLESRSEHPVANAILNELKKQSLELEANISGFDYFPGQGVAGVIDGQSVMAGQIQWLRNKKINIDSLLENKAEKYQEQGYSSLFLAVNENIVALFVLFDPLKSDAKSTINTLKKMGFNISLLSGDRYSTVQSVAIQLGGLEAFAEVLPQQKYQIIQQFQQSQKTVIMVGDGINDAPALIMADIGIAIGSGTDISIESADIVLTHDKLEQIIQSIELSRQCLRTIHQNIIISILYNIIMVPLAMMAFVTPLVAAITMPISSLLVIMNASRLRIKKGKN